MAWICDKTKCIGNCLDHRESSAASDGYGRDCWYCGTSPAPHRWQTVMLDETRNCPMCSKHDATTRVALRLREIGETATADMLDDAIGIDTRPEFVQWMRP